MWKSRSFAHCLSPAAAGHRLPQHGGLMVLVNGAALWSRLSGNGNIYLFERRYLFAEAGCFERVKDV